MEKIRLLIIDDSALIRTMLSKIFESSDAIEVVGTAADPLIARDKIKKLKPDVLTLDIEMPRMNGLTFLHNLMRLRPMPVLMISTLTEKGAEVTLEALSMGAVDFVAKPKVDVANTLNAYAEDLIEKVKTAAKANVGSESSSASHQSNHKQAANISTKLNTPTDRQATTPKKQFATTEKIIAIGSSTGGTEAVKNVVKGLPRTTPAIVITQHLPAAFSTSFAKHVNEVTEMKVCVAEEGQVIKSGHIYIAPGDKHLLVLRSGTHYVCQLNDGQLVNRFKPSVEVMFHSIAQNVGSNAIGVMLTGMGSDGAVAMKEMRDAGSSNIIQDEASSVVWGMPGEAFRQGAAHYVQPLDQVAAQILALVK